MPEEIEKEARDVESEESPEKAGRVLDEFDWEDSEGKRKKAVLRYAKGEDLDGIKNVEMDKWRFRGETYGDEFNAQREWTQENTDKLREDLNDSRKSFLVLTVDNEVVGHIEFTKSFNPSDKTVYVDTITVMQKYNRQGFATGLLERATEEAKKSFNAEHISLGTQEENKSSNILYDKFGFEEVSKELSGRKWKWVDEEGKERTDCYDLKLMLDIKKWEEQWKGKKDKWKEKSKDKKE